MGNFYKTLFKLIESDENFKKTYHTSYLFNHAINEIGREKEEDFIFQVDKDENDNNVHLTLELTSCIDNRVLFSTYQEEEQLDYSNSDLF